MADFLVMMSSVYKPFPEIVHMRWTFASWLDCTSAVLVPYDNERQSLLEMQAASVYLRTPREWNYWLCHIDCVADLARPALLAHYDVLTAHSLLAAEGGGPSPCAWCSFQLPLEAN